MADKIRVLLTEEEVNKKISEVAAQINKDYEGKEVHLICILKGGVFFTCELAKRLTIPVSLDFMSVSSYGSDTKSSGVVKIIKDLDEPLEGKNVIIVEDIIDSGRTLAYLIEVLKQRNPKNIELCTLLDKPERRVKKQVQVKYTCFRIRPGLRSEIPQPAVHRCCGSIRRKPVETTSVDGRRGASDPHAARYHVFLVEGPWNGDGAGIKLSGVHGISGK